MGSNWRTCARLKAAGVLDDVLSTAYEYAVLADETFSYVSLNPPFDGEGMTGGGRRLEETFLLDTTPRLMPGGVLGYTIPHHRINEKIARHLAGWYDDLRCFDFVAEDYALYKQIVNLRRAAQDVCAGERR